MTTDWKEPVTANKLKEYWLSGMPALEIANKMRVSKNSVVGAAHRAGLPARPSPILLDRPGRSDPTIRAKAGSATLPPLAAVAIEESPEDADFRVRWLRGDTTVIMAVHFDVSPGSISNRAARLGLEPRKHRRKDDEINPPVEGMLPPPVTRSEPPIFGPPRSCQFPLWPHNARPSGRFCEGKVKLGSSYCEEHRARCYTPMTVDRRRAA